MKISLMNKIERQDGAYGTDWWEQKSDLFMEPLRCLRKSKVYILPNIQRESPTTAFVAKEKVQQKMYHNASKILQIFFTIFSLPMALVGWIFASQSETRSIVSRCISQLLSIQKNSNLSAFKDTWVQVDLPFKLFVTRTLRKSVAINFPIIVTLTHFEFRLCDNGSSVRYYSNLSANIPYREVRMIADAIFEQHEPKEYSQTDLEAMAQASTNLGINADKKRIHGFLSPSMSAKLQEIIKSKGFRSMHW